MIRDRIYGSFEIGEQVLVDLIHTPAMQRLRKIYEAARFPNNNEKMISSTRYQHSVGVMLLLRKYGASMDEQIAGLLHDVSHTAFSHAIDRVVGDHVKQDYQDNRHDGYVRSTGIPSILAKHGYDVGRIVDIKSGAYRLLENQLPDICADRIDYSLRNFAKWENPRAVGTCLQGLVNYKGRFVFLSRPIARLFAENYLECQIRNWGSVKYNAMEYIFSKALMLAMRKGIINIGDLLYTYDNYVMGKLRKSRDRDIRELLGILEHRIRYHEVRKDPDYINRVKLRYTDPYYADGGRLRKLSENDPAFRKRLDAYLAADPVRIRFDYGPEIRRLLTQ